MDSKFAELNKEMEAFKPVEVQVMDKKGRRFGTGLEITDYDALVIAMMRKSNFRPASARPPVRRTAAVVFCISGR